MERPTNKRTSLRKLNHFCVRNMFTEVRKLITTDGERYWKEIYIEQFGNDYQDSPLCYACGGEDSRRELVEFLLSLPFILETINNDVGFGKTVLHNAMWWGNAELVKVLVAHGADSSKLDDQGRTPEEYANTF